MRKDNFFYPFSIVLFALTPVYSNNTMASAEALEINAASPTTISLSGATAEDEGEPECTVPASDLKDIYYRIEGIEQNGNDFSIFVDVTNVSGGVRLEIMVFDENGNQVTCDRAAAGRDANFSFTAESGLMYYIQFGDNPNDGDHVGSANVLVTTPAILQTLPIVLGSDLEVITHGSEATFQWQTTVETNSEAIEIHASYDGKKWFYIDEVSSFNDGTSLKWYDHTVRLNTSQIRYIMYFRLVNRDVNGSKQVFPFVRAYFHDYENYFASHVTMGTKQLHITALPEHISGKVILTSSYGQRLAVEKLQLGIIQFDHCLPSGLYFIQIIDSKTELPLTPTKKMVVP